MRPATATCTAASMALVALATAAGGRPLVPDRFDPEPAMAPPAERGPWIAQDTTWIADWTFDGASGCDPQGFTVVDHYARNDGSNFWSVGSAFDGQGFVTGNAAILRRHDPCWARDGYGNSWDQALVLRYTGAGALLSFDFVLDSEPGVDFLVIEADSLCSSELRAGTTSPPAAPAGLRRVQAAFDGPHPAGRVTALALPDFGAPDSIHCVYLRFVSDGRSSDEDGEHASSIAAGVVIDNLALGGPAGWSEGFEGVLHPNVALRNSAPSLPYATFARLETHPPDLDPVGEDSTCAWVFTDSAFACNGGPPAPPCVRPLADNSIESPWVALSGTGPVLLSWREWLSNAGSGACMVRRWAVRGRTRVPNPDTPAPDDSIDCVAEWSGNFAFPTSNSWVTRTYDVTSRLPAGARAIQVRLRVMPLAFLIDHDPNPSCAPSPGGPILDRVRIGRIEVPSDVPPEPDGAVLPRTVLHPNVPNPFHPHTAIRFDLARSGPVELAVYDVAGRRVRVLHRGRLQAGRGHRVAWDGCDATGRRLAGGVYFCRLVAGDATVSRRFVLVD